MESSRTEVEVVAEHALKDGYIAICLEGRKLKGGYALTRIGKGERWLLGKIRDDKADARRNSVKTEPRSVLSGQSIEEMGSNKRLKDTGKEGGEHGLGPGGFCKCPKCDYKVKHEAGKPCRALICPKCDVALVRRFTRG